MLMELPKLVERHFLEVELFHVAFKLRYDSFLIIHSFNKYHLFVKLKSGYPQRYNLRYFNTGNGKSLERCGQALNCAIERRRDAPPQAEPEKHGPLKLR